MAAEGNTAVLACPSPGWERPPPSPDRTGAAGNSAGSSARHEIKQPGSDYGRKNDMGDSGRNDGADGRRVRNVGCTAVARHDSNEPDIDLLCPLVIRGVTLRN